MCVGVVGVYKVVWVGGWVILNRGKREWELERR